MPLRIWEHPLFFVGSFQDAAPQQIQRLNHGLLAYLLPVSSEHVLLYPHLIL